MTAIDDKNDEVKDPRENISQQKREKECQK